MALTTNNREKVREALNWAYCQNGLLIPWDRTSIDPEIAALDNFMDTNDATVNLAFGLLFRGATTASDRALIYLCLVIARRLASTPSHLAVLKTILDRVVA